MLSSTLAKPDPEISRPSISEPPHLHSLGLMSSVEGYKPKSPLPPLSLIGSFATSSILNWSVYYREQIFPSGRFWASLKVECTGRNNALTFLVNGSLKAGGEMILMRFPSQDQVTISPSLPPFLMLRSAVVSLCSSAPPVYVGSARHFILHHSCVGIRGIGIRVDRVVSTLRVMFPATKREVTRQSRVAPFAREVR